MFVGQDWSSDAYNLRTSIYILLNLKLHEECLRTLGMGLQNSWGYKWMQSGSGSQSGRKQGALAQAAAEVDTIEEQQPNFSEQAVVEANA